MKSYHGYDAHIEYDASAETFHGSVPGIRGAITFDGHSVIELERAFHESVDYYLGFCERTGVTPEKPYSGKFLVRAAPELHGDAARAASHAGMSLNAWVLEAIASHLGGDRSVVAIELRSS